MLLTDRVTDSAWYSSIKDRCTYTGMSKKATSRAHTISLKDQQLLLLMDFGHFIHIYSLVVKFPSFCLLAMRCPRPAPISSYSSISVCTPWWQIACVMCGCVYMVVLRTLLHCFLLLHRSTWCCVERLADRWHGNTAHRWTLNPSHLFIRFLFRCSAREQALSESALCPNWGRKSNFGPYCVSEKTIWRVKSEETCNFWCYFSEWRSFSDIL